MMVHKLGIAGLQTAYASGETTASAVIEAAYARIDAIDDELNAFTELDRETAYQCAADSEQRIESSAPRALEGVPVAVKANIDVKGLATHSGMDARRGHIATADAQVVTDLRAAGAIIIGSLNMEEAALGAKTDNPWFGATHNPHRIDYTAGGSSGGSGAAVAAGLCTAALGTDTMGSVRIPSAYCGIYGLKTARGAVSQNGFDMVEPSLDTIGPMARSLEDLETISRVMMDFGEARPITNVALLENLSDVECDAAVLTGYEAAKKVLPVSGHFGFANSLSRIRYAGFIICARGLSVSLAPAMQSKPDGISDHLKTLMQYGAQRGHDKLAGDRAILADTAANLRDVVHTYGAILMPAAPQAAFPHSEDAPANQADFTALANISGLPALSVPAGCDDNGLPVAVQLVGRSDNIGGLFTLARRLDTALNAYRPPALF